MQKYEKNERGMKIFCIFTSSKVCNYSWCVIATIDHFK